MSLSTPTSLITIQDANVAALRNAAAEAAVNSAVYDIEAVNAPTTCLCAHDECRGAGVARLTDSEGTGWDLCLACAIAAVEDRVRVPDSHTDVEVSW